MNNYEKMQNFVKIGAIMQEGFILPIVLVLTSIILFLIFAINDQNVIYLKKMQDLEQTAQIEDLAQRNIYAMLDILNSQDLQKINKTNFQTLFGTSGLFIDSSKSNIKAGISGVKSCKKKYNSSLLSITNPPSQISGCVQISIVFPDSNQAFFYYLLNLHLINSQQGIEKFYQAIAYNLTDSSFSALPNWVATNGTNLGFSGTELVNFTECDFFVRKIYPANPCK